MRRPPYSVPNVDLNAGFAKPKRRCRACAQGAKTTGPPGEVTPSGPKTRTPNLGAWRAESKTYAKTATAETGTRTKVGRAGTGARSAPHARQPPAARARQSARDPRMARGAEASLADPGGNAEELKRHLSRTPAEVAAAAKAAEVEVEFAKAVAAKAAEAAEGRRIIGHAKDRRIVDRLDRLAAEVRELSKPVPQPAPQPPPPLPPPDKPKRGRPKRDSPKLGRPTYDWTAILKKADKLGDGLKLASELRAWMKPLKKFKKSGVPAERTIRRHLEGWRRGRKESEKG
jgi:hypothetical protein